MKLPFEILNIHSKLMDNQEKPKSIEDYIDIYFRHYQPITLYKNNGGIHCNSACNRSYSDLYMLVYNYFKEYFNEEISFPKFIYTITMMYKRNVEFLNKSRGAKEKLYYIQCFHCPDINKYVSYRNCTSSLEGCIRTFYHSQFTNKKINPIVDRIHYMYIDLSINMENIKNEQEIYDHYEYHREYCDCGCCDDCDDDEDWEELFSDGCSSEFLNKSFEEYVSTVGYKIIALPHEDSVKSDIHDEVMNLGEHIINGKGLILYAVSNELFDVINEQKIKNGYRRNFVDYENNKRVCLLMVENINYYIKK